METFKEMLGPEHPDTLKNMANPASTYRSQQRWEEAEDLQVQVMETRKEVLGPEHLSTLISMGNLASIYWNQGRLKEAEELEVQVMETRKEILGPEHPDTLTSMNNLAFTLRSLGKNEAAVKMMAQCAESHNQQLGPSHPSTLSSMSTWKQWHSTDETSPFKPAVPHVETLLEDETHTTSTEATTRASSMGSLSKRQIFITLLMLALSLIYVLNGG
ncbi:uncharacterized protein N7483_007669 [Penicillium malachiteum]|uniref:uncharacterized protein n=1 Tax=Penicillium malachiteum TaxID=1324776 RepID=UPI002548AB78|nr:uncharacterized protein N7483_007669 [Penicillium malachiteum]KAJ5726312.1 hypothetical protein N7483_007669 [Penicillium malachiteum]